MKKILLTLSFIWGIILMVNAQELTIQSINDFENPQHRDRIGSWMLGDVLNVKGTYTIENAKKVSIRLLTYAAGTWSQPLAVYNVIVDEDAPFSGIIDNDLVIPDDYMLGVESGDGANTQILQVSVEYDGASRQFSNFSLTVIERPVSKVIDYDAEYAPASGGTLVSNINSAIADANPGDTILFKSSEYDFDGKALSIPKGICISGAFPDNIEPGTMGAYDVATTFRNLKVLNVQSGDIGICNIKLMPYDEVGYVFTRFIHPTYGNSNEMKFHTNIKVSNVIFENGKLQCFGGNGVGVTFRNVSFLNYDDGGFATNRRGSVDYSPQVVVKCCKFVPNFAEVNYNVRGVSLDAGNDEYPEVWDMSGMVIDSCFFDGTGVAWSKCENAVVTNNHFVGYRKDVDMIHMEEFTSDILIQNNTFEFIRPSRCLYIDRSTQRSHDIQVLNNTFIGKYHWVFWCYSPYNITVENNDFTRSGAANPKAKTFDFVNLHTKEKFPYEIPMENVVIRNNKGLDQDSHGIFAYNTLKGDKSNLIEGYAPNKIVRRELDQKPKSLVDTDKLYRLRNKTSGEYVVSEEGDTKVLLSNKSRTDNSDVWKVSYIYPFSYSLLNVKTGQYLEMDAAYTLNAYRRDVNPTLYVEQKSDYAGKEAVPHFVLRGIKGKPYDFQLSPGCNEFKSRIIKQGEYMVIELAKDRVTKEMLPPTAASTWELVEVKHD